MIRVNQQPAILAWDTKQGRLDQEGNGKQVLNIETEKPELQITTRKPKLTIDQSEPFAEAGLKGIRAFMDDSVAFSRQKLSQGIDRIVSDGNEWINIHTGQDPIPDQAVRNAFEMFDKEFNFAMIPTSRPKIDVEPGEVNLDLKRGKVVNNTQNEKVRMNYSPWSINYYMKQYNSIEFRFEPNSFSETV